MLDVHVPEGGMHSVKDFLLHIFTITVGLFIALMLEGCVEKVHQHHLRDEANSNIQKEIHYNDHEVQTTVDAASLEKKNLVEILKFLQARTAGKPYDIRDINIGFSFGSPSDANWRTATATGALTFMEYDRVQNFAAAYQVQEIFSHIEQQTLDDFLQLQSYVAYGFDPDKMTPEEAKAAAVDVRKTLAHLVALSDIGNGLRSTYAKTLSEK